MKEVESWSNSEVVALDLEVGFQTQETVSLLVGLRLWYLPISVPTKQEHCTLDHPFICEMQNLNLLKNTSESMEWEQLD